MILIVLIRIRKYFVLLWNKNKILTRLQIKASHSLEKLNFVRPENFQWFFSWVKQQKIGLNFCTSLALSKYFSPVTADDTYNIAGYYLV